MKRILKILTVVALIGIFCMLFAGCDALDEMKANHAILSEDKKTVSFQGKTFVKLPEGIPYYFNDTYSNRITVTESDVPVLLSEDFGYSGYYDPLNDIMAVSDIYTYDGTAQTYLSSEYSPEEYQCTYFTQQENYEKYSTLTIEEADRVGFSNMMYSYGTAIFSRSASEEILKLIKNTEPWNNEAYEYAQKNAYDNIYPLVRCNNTPIKLRSTLNGYEIFITNDKDVYLVNYYAETGVKLSDSTAEDVKEKLYSR